MSKTQKSYVKLLSICKVSSGVNLLSISSFFLTSAKYDRAVLLTLEYNQKSQTVYNTVTEILIYFREKKLNTMVKHDTI